jgi:PBP1b-binding outer membrane lipoprotein LpoB
MLRLSLSLALATLLAGCSTEQAYTAGQGWRKNQCYQLTNPQDRQRCLKEADQSYDSYQKEAEKVRGSE